MLSPTSLRTHVSPDEMEILSIVAVAGSIGHFVEYGKSTAEHQFLVEDGLLSVETRPGTSRSYSRYRLTEAGDRALARWRPTDG